MSFQYPSIIMDLNSSSINAGLSTHDTPTTSISPFYSSGFQFDPVLPTSSGDEIYTLFQEGIYYNYNAFPHLINYTYSKLNLSSESIKELPLTVSQNAWFDNKQITKLSEIVFEEFEVPIFSVLKRQLCTAYAMSKPNNCIVVDFDNDFVSVTPINNGKILKKGLIKTNFAGDFINLFVLNYLEKHGINDEDLLPIDYQNLSSPLTESFKNFAITKTVIDFKKSILNLNLNSIDIDSKSYQTPSKKLIHINKMDQYNLIQPIFKPYDSYKLISSSNNLSTDAEGLGNLIFKSLKNIGGSGELYVELLNNLIIQGEMSYIPGLEDAILNDLRLYIKDYQISSYLSQDNLDRGIESWIGANILSKFEDLYVSRSEWLEKGGDYIVEKFK